MSRQSREVPKVIFLGPTDTDFSIPYLSSGEEAGDQRVVLQALRPAEPLLPSCTLTNICKLEYLTNKN